ncbi:MAG: hypothetical protein LLG20_01865 [Acidobacteriales bacterium]|nr:hypothetical protein [Terriglobales bacterium]
MIASTTDATPTELLTAGAGRITLDGLTGVVYEALAVACDASGNTKAWRIAGAIKRVGSTTSLVNVAVPEVLARDTAAEDWTLVVSADDTNEALKFTGTGAAATSITWTCSVKTVTAAGPGA